VQLADAGAAGCTYARPLHAMRRALDANPANAGFLRRDAFLVVVLLTNDDDCSFGNSSYTGGELDRSRCTNAGGLVPVDQYVAFLRALKDDPNQVVVVGAFAPPGGPACADTRPATRLAAFLDGFPNRAASASICEPDFSAPLGLAGQLTRSSLGLPCFSAPPLDVDPVAEGRQVDCAAWYRYGDRGAVVEELIPTCRGDELFPCWQLRPEPQCLGSGDSPELRDRPRGGFDPPFARAIFECVTR
jgi:hypothetical protein